MGDLSAHFSKREFACRCCGVWAADPFLIRVLENIRARSGKPLRIVSGFRCVEHNKSVGGAPGSQHVTGKAADIDPGRATLAQARAAGAAGIGTRGKWAVHVDVRATPSTWSYGP